MEIRPLTNTLSNLGNVLQRFYISARLISVVISLDSGGRFDRFHRTKPGCGRDCFGVQLPSLPQIPDSRDDWVVC